MVSTDLLLITIHTSLAKLNATVRKIVGCKEFGKVDSCVKSVKELPPWGKFRVSKKSLMSFRLSVSD